MQKYFVMHLTDIDLMDRGRQVDDRCFEIQILDAEGAAACCGYVCRNDLFLEVAGQSIPLPVIEAAKRQLLGEGDYVDGFGNSVPFF